MRRPGLHAGLVAIAIGGVLRSAGAQSPPAISADRLRERLTAFAHDSTQGRETGTAGYARATTYLVDELKRLGVAPAGERDQYYQVVPMHHTRLDVTQASLVLTRRVRPSAIAGSINDKRLAPGIGFMPIVGAFGLATPPMATIPATDSFATIVYGGRLGDSHSISAAAAAGKIVALFAPQRPDGQPDFDLWNARSQLLVYRDAAAILVGTLELMPQDFLTYLAGPRLTPDSRVAEVPRMPPILAITEGGVEETIRTSTPFFVFSQPHHGRDTTFSLDHASLSYDSRDAALANPARNVIAMIEGSDARLASEFVVLSAHADHLGVAPSGSRVGSDSIFNGADDGGTGSVALLEIAQYIASLPEKPKRSVLFLWTVAEEQGFLGAEYFVDHPTRGRDKIVANITVDMIGGRGADDRADGSSLPVQAIGAERRSSQFSDWIASISGSELGLTVDRSRSPPNECGGDDWHFARYGIPSVRISTGRSPWYHAVGDDVSHIDFDQYARVTRLVATMAIDIANRPARPRADKPAPDSRQACVW